MLHTQNSKAKVAFEVVDPESGDADLWAIKKAAQAIRERMGKINAAEHWIIIGAELAALKEALVKSRGGNRPGDNERIGWAKAYELGILPFDRRYADRLIETSQALKWACGPTSKNLPVGTKALYIIASRFKDEKMIKRLIEEGRITAASTEIDLRNLGHDLGLIPKTIKAGVDAHSSKGRRVDHVLKLMQKLQLNISDLRGVK
jgi:hypothetical protein